MATDRLREAKPRRLHRDQGVWVLDVERFVSLGQGVLRPKVERLQGEMVIQQYLAQHPGAHALSRTVTQLMRDTGGDAKTPPPIFEVVGEGWVPVFAVETDVIAEAPTRPSPRPVPPPAAATEATRPAAAPDSPDSEALIRALGAMRLAHNKLQARVEELERLVVSLTARATGAATTSPMMPLPVMPSPAVPPLPAGARPAAAPVADPRGTAATQSAAQVRVTVPPIAGRR